MGLIYPSHDVESHYKKGINYEVAGAAKKFFEAATLFEQNHLDYTSRQRGARSK